MRSKPSSAEVAAIKMSEILGERILAEHPEVAELYRRIERIKEWSKETYMAHYEEDIWSVERIAKHVFPEEVQINSQVAAKAVSYSLEHLLSSYDKARLGKLHQLAGTYHSLSEYGAPRARLTPEQTAAVKKKAKENWSKFSGRELWGDEEIKDLATLALLPGYKKGKRLAAKELAIVLNAKHHKNRDGRAVSNFMQDPRVKAIQQNL